MRAGSPISEIYKLSIFHANSGDRDRWLFALGIGIEIRILEALKQIQENLEGGLSGIAAWTLQLRLQVWELQVVSLVIGV